MADGPNPLPPASTPVIDEQNNLTLPWRRALQNVGQAAGGGITQLTGDVTAGPGGGAQAAALSTTGVSPGAYTNLNATIDAKGRVITASSGASSEGELDPLTLAACSLLDGAITVTAAYTLARARTFTYTGDATGGPTSFNGSANVSTALTLATVNANVGSFGSATQVATFTVNGKGLITAAASVTITAPTLQTARTFSYTGDATGGPTSFDGSANVSTALTLANTAVTPATYGDATHVGQFTVDAKGRLTFAGNVVITPSAGTPGGSSGQIQYNNAGAFGGFTASGDATIDTATGVVTVVQAAKWTTGRTLAITGDLAYTSPSFDGSGNVTAAGTLATVNSNVGSFTYASITVNGKGLITAASSGAAPTGTVTTTGSPASGNLAKFSGATSITNDDLSGDVTTSGTLATTIGALKVATGMVQASAITFAKMQNIATDSLIGRDTASSGDPENILLNATLSMDGSGNLRRAALTGDVTASAGSNATAIAANAVTTTTINNAAVTLAKIANAAANSVWLGAGSAGTGIAYTENTFGTGLAVSGTVLSVTGNPSVLAYQDGSVPGGNTIASTVADTAFASSYTIPANSLVVGSVINVELFGVYSTALVAPTLTLKLKVGGTTVLASSAINTLVGSSTNLGWYTKASFIVIAIGASGSLECQGLAEFSTNSVAAAGLLENLTNTAVVGAINTTTTLAVAASVTWGTSSSSNTITLRSMTVEIESTGAVAVPTFTGARAYNDGAQSILNNTATVITFASEEFDTNAIHSTSSNTSRFTIPTGYSGKWRFTYGGVWAATATTGARIALLLKNGATGVIGSVTSLYPSNAIAAGATGTATVDLVAGDYVELQVFQNSGGAVNFGSTLAAGRQNAASLECQWLGA